MVALLFEILGVFFPCVLLLLVIAVSLFESVFPLFLDLKGQGFGGKRRRALRASTELRQGGRESLYAGFQ
jgi:hypothetical protein